jgi:hypothetical protein
MTDDHETAAAFELRLREVLAAYGRPAPSPEALCTWWCALAPFDLAPVTAALAEHAAECRFAPVPADLVARILARDGRPGADEAWSIALCSADEADTVVWTAEIAAARAVALPVLAAGDEVGARKAFIEAYQRELTAARRALRPVQWQVSLGTDPSGRAGPIAAAERRGLLPHGTTARLLPASAVSVLDLLPGSVAGASAVAGAAGGAAGPPTAGVAALPPDRLRDARQLLAAVRDGLAQGAVARRAAQAEQAAARAAAAEQAARARALAAALRAHRRFVLLRRAARAAAAAPGRGRAATPAPAAATRRASA